MCVARVAPREEKHPSQPNPSRAVLCLCSTLLSCSLSSSRPTSHDAPRAVSHVRLHFERSPRGVGRDWTCARSRAVFHLWPLHGRPRRVGARAAQSTRFYIRQRVCPHCKPIGVGLSVGTKSIRRISRRGARVRAEQRARKHQHQHLNRRIVGAAHRTTSRSGSSTTPRFWCSPPRRRRRYRRCSSTRCGG